MTDQLIDTVGHCLRKVKIPGLDCLTPDEARDRLGWDVLNPIQAYTLAVDLIKMLNEHDYYIVHKSMVFKENPND